MIIASVRIRHEEIEKAHQALNKKRGICRIYPESEFGLFYNQESQQFVFNGLVCDDRMEGENTGVHAECCSNCILNIKL